MGLPKLTAMSAFIDVFAIALALPFLVASDAAAQKVQESEMAPRAEESLLLDSTTAGNSIIVVGERGHILKSTDQGSSWRQIIAPTRVMLTAVDFLDADFGFAVGHDSIILGTQDGGSNWQVLHRGLEEDRPLLDVLVHDRQRITAIGAYGHYLESKDGGLTWNERRLTTSEDNQAANEQTEKSLADDFHLNGIAVAENGHWYIAAERGTVYRSENGGRRWVRLPSPYDGSFFGVLPLTADQVLVFGMQGRMYYSEDSGENWQAVDTGTSAALTNASILNDGSIVVAGHSGTMLLAEGGHNGFNLKQLPKRMAVSAATELADGDLLLVGTEGLLRWSPRDP